MDFKWSPVSALSELYKLDRKSATIVVAGLAILSAAALLGTASIDHATMITTGIYVLCFGVLLTIVANLPKFLATILSSFVVMMIIVIVTTIFVSAVTTPAWPKPPYCIVKVWDECDGKKGQEEAATNRNAASIDKNVRVPAAVPLPAPAVTPSIDKAMPPPRIAPPGDTISIKFAGLITRESITEFNTALRRGGWNVVGTSGDRTGDAAGVNEVRYASDADQDVAQALADAASKTGIASKPVTIRKSDIAPSTMELWLSN